MDKPKLQKTHGPEWYIQQDVIAYLRAREWHVMVTHGNAHQSGFPDLYCTHKDYRQRWIDIKCPDKYSFTKAQLDNWPVMSRVVGIWIMTAATESEYKKLFGPANWQSYLLNFRGVGGR